MKLKEIQKLKKDFQGEDLELPKTGNSDYVYDRYMNITKQSTTWRRLTIIFALLSVVATGGLIVKSFEKQSIPYVIRIDNTGNINGNIVSQAEDVTLSEKEIEYFITNLFTKVRNVPIDSKFYTQKLEEVYPFLSKNAKNKLQDFVNNTTNTNAVIENKYSIKASIDSFIKYDNNKYQVNWTETTYNNTGVVTFNVSYTAIVDITYIDVKTTDQIRTNPIGLILKDLEIKRIGG